MAKIIDEVYKRVQLIANKDQNSGYIGPDQFKEHAALAQYKIISDALKTSYEASLTISDSISALKKMQPISVTNNYAEEPEDYMSFSSAKYVDFSKGHPIHVAVEYVTDDELATRLMSELEPPTTRFPVIAKEGSGFRVYPNIPQVNLTYIKVPPAPVWGYTTVNGRPVYDDATSVDFVLGHDDIASLVYMICQQIGIEVREPELFQGSTAQDNKQ